VELILLLSAQEKIMRRALVLAAAAALATIACSGESGSPSSPSGPSGPSGSQGTLNLRITDSPFGKAKAVLVTFSDVSMHRNGDWKKVAFADGSTTRTCDLKKLENSTQDLLGTGPLEAGEYTMIRLVVQSARVYLDNAAVSATPCAPSIPAPAGAVSNATMPSGEVKLNGSFGVAAGGATTILIDFDGESSFSQTGNGSYMINPVIRILSVQ
jgi:hypothetical protein